MIRRYQTRCDELDDEAPPEERNELFHSQVGNRWASRGDHDAVGGASMDKALDAAIDPPDPDNPRTLAQRREAAAVRIYRFFLDQGESPTEDGERPHIAITVPLESLVTGEFETTGDLSLSSSQISELLCDSKLQIIVTDGQGNPLDVGADVYRPSRRMRRAILFRDHRHQPRRPMYRQHRESAGCLGRVVKDDPERGPSAGVHGAHAVAHRGVRPAALGSDRSVASSEHERVPAWDHGRRRA
jgi:hypothetical protein